MNRDTYKVNEMELEDNRNGWGFWFWHPFDAPPLPDEKHETAAGSGGDTPWGKVKADRSVVKAGGGTYGPNVMPTYINIDPPRGFRQYFFEQPVDVDKTRIFFLNMRNFMLEPEKDGPIHARNKVIAGQDIAILNELYPRMTPISNTKEVLMPADGPIAAYREWLAKFDDMGWRIDWEEFSRRNGVNTAFAIPSPARRNSGNWVLEPVPLLEGREARKQRKDAAA
jgi:phenylpropionate dioxygenase-like ring-hydroxylating dioxygenase large terminal subunit